MILQTGGLLFGEISTRSMPASAAILMANTVSTVPLLVPSTSINWICALRISSLVRGPSLVAAGGALLGRRMGGSPGLLKRRANLMDDAAAGKPAYAHIVYFQVRRSRFYQQFRPNSRFARAQSGGQAVSPEEPAPENLQFRGASAPDAT